MLRLSLTSLWARKRRMVGTGLAVIIGVAFLTGTLILGDTMKANFDRLFTEVSAGTDVVIRNHNAVETDNATQDDHGLLSQALVQDIRGLDGVADVQGQIVGYGSLLGRDGDAIGGNGPPRLAGSWVTDPELNPYRLVEGRAPRADDEVVVNRGAADDGNLKVGDVTTVQSPQPVRVRIVGIATFGDAAGLGTTTFTAFSLAGAQEHVTGQPGRVSSIVVRADDGVSSSELRDRIRAELPRGVEAITGQQLTDEQIDNISSTFLDMLRTFLVAFAGIALVVATLSINNTFTITVAQRTRELALMRAVGASRRQVRSSVAIEGLVVGAVSAAIGALAGLGVAGLLKGLFDSFGFALPAGGLTVHASALLIGLAAGTLATFIAAQLPARRAARVAPIAALQQAGAEARDFGTRRVLVGVGILAAGAVGATVGALSGSFLPAGLGGLALVVGALFVAPVLLPPVARVVGGVLRRTRGVSGMLAEENARRNPRRSAATATALVIGVTVVSLFTLFTASLGATLDEQVRSGITSDLVVGTPSFGGGRLSPAVAGEIRDLPEVGQAVGVGSGQVRLDGSAENVTTTDVRSLPEVMDVDAVAGSLRDVGPDQLAVSRDYATDHRWRLGTPVTMTFAGGGETRADVGAIFDDADLLFDVVVPSALWNQHTIQPTESAVLVNTASGVSEAAARRAITPIADRNGGDLQTLAEYADAQTGGLDTLLNIVYVMLALAILIALLGIANTLSLAVYERRTELGLLRAVGETRRQVRSMLRLESVILATFGTVLGLVLGGLLGYVLFTTVSGSGAFTVPPVPIVVIAVLGSLAGVLAALRPARRAARLPILESIATT
jgi:putative ABC transport system permease protein